MTPKPRTIRARSLRRDATDAERRLWYALREADIEARVRRQHPIGRFVADFAIPAHGLVIEIDGGQHARNTEADAARSAELNAHGYRVLRFWNHEVLNDIEGVVATILGEIGTAPSSPRPSPPHGRRGR